MSTPVRGTFNQNTQTLQYPPPTRPVNSCDPMEEDFMLKYKSKTASARAWGSMWCGISRVGNLSWGLSVSICSKSH